MWLLNCDTYQLESFEGESHPPYGILSHRWENKEVSFQDVRVGRQADLEGWQKIRSCCEQAKRDQLDYIWADTCCIDKRSSAELSEAINSMYKWYKEAAICYAYLADVVSEAKLTESIWFTRGWTLQELLAPKDLVFYSCDWRSLGTKIEHRRAIEERTGISTRALYNFEPKDYFIAQKMSWAAGRKTSRVEDRTYSLLGLFDVNMPLLYGEGNKAFERLQYELIRTSIDTTIYAWSTPPSPPLQAGPLAISPDCYDWKHSHELVDYAEGTSVSKEGVSGRFTLLPFCFDVYVASLCRLQDEAHMYCKVDVVIFLKKIDHNLYRRVLLDGRSYAIMNFGWRLDLALPWEAPLITIQFEPVIARSSETMYDRDHDFDWNRFEVTPGLLGPTRLLKKIKGYRFVGEHIVKLLVWTPGIGLGNQPIVIRPDYQEGCSGPSVLLDFPYYRTSRMIVTFRCNFRDEPTALTYFLRAGVDTHRNIRLPNFCDRGRSSEGTYSEDEDLFVGKPNTRKSRTAWKTSKDRRALTSAFDAIDKEKMKGVKVQQLGSNVKVAFVRVDCGYRVLLALKSSKGGDRLPREWLYPAPEGRKWWSLVSTVSG